MATGAPTGASLNESRVVNPADQQPARGGLLLEMALEAKGLVAFREELIIH